MTERVVTILLALSFLGNATNMPKPTKDLRSQFIGIKRGSKLQIGRTVSKVDTVDCFLTPLCHGADSSTNRIFLQQRLATGECIGFVATRDNGLDL